MCLSVRELRTASGGHASKPPHGPRVLRAPAEPGLATARASADHRARDLSTPPGPGRCPWPPMAGTKKGASGC